MKLHALVLGGLVLPVALLGFVSAASAQTVAQSTVVSSPQAELDIVGVQVAALAMTPIVTPVDQAQALLILQSLARNLANLSAEIGTS